MSWLVVLSLVLCGSAHAQSISESDQHKAAEYAEWFEQGLRAADLPATLPPDGRFSQTGARVDFECEALENTPLPTSIDNLSPKYVNVIAALGDSVTAAFGAGSSTIIDTREYRGLSWSIGGDKDLTEVQTLANAVRLFNTSLYGFSTGTGTSNAELNVAVSGARTRNMKEQAENLVKKMQEKGITDADWKVITMWIGGNDICDIRANGPSPEELAAQYTENVREALDYLRDNVKNAFVNLASMIDIAKLYEVKGITCSIVHEFACNSIQKEETRELASKTSHLYNEHLEGLIDKGNRYTSTDFTVVIQPFFSETPVPKLPDGSADKSYFAPDCFHFSQKGHGIGGLYLWNNMFEPVGNKTIAVDWDNQQTFVCPKDYPFFRTYKNSKTALLKTDVSNNEQGSSHHAAILVGTGVGVVVVALATIVISIGIVRSRQRGRGREYGLPKRGPPSEKMRLLHLMN